MSSNEFQVDASVLYNQFELFADEQKWTQIVLLNDLIYKIKEAFNKEFESIFQKKLQELAKIRERNTRIKQINADLDDTSPVWEPDLTEKERPQLLFEVKDNEVSHDFNRPVHDHIRSFSGQSGTILHTRTVETIRRATSQ